MRKRLISSRRRSNSAEGGSDRETPAWLSSRQEDPDFHHTGIGSARLEACREPVSSRSRPWISAEVTRGAYPRVVLLVNRCRGDAASDWSRLLSVFGSAEAVTDLGVLKDGLVRGPPGVFVPPLYMARKSCSDDVNLDPERLGDLSTGRLPGRRGTGGEYSGGVVEGLVGWQAGDELGDDLVGRGGGLVEDPFERGRSETGEYGCRIASPSTMTGMVSGRTVP